MSKYFKPIALFLLLSLSYKSDAQEVINYKSTTYLSGFGSFASGKYARSLALANFKTQSFGGTLGYLHRLSNDITFPISMGGEFGIHGLGAGTVSSQVGGEFRTSNTAYWLNGVIRYRPIFWTYFINPFVDLSLGPKLISTGIFEQFTEEEYSRLEGKSSLTFNSTLGAGVGIKIPNREEKVIYLDIGIYYQQTGATKIVEQNTVAILPGDEIIYRQQVTPLNNTQLRVGLTWFR